MSDVTLEQWLDTMGYYSRTDPEFQVSVGRELIARANVRYETGDPILTDEAWLELVQRINAIEQANGLTLTSDCSEVPTSLATLKPMYSLNKVYDSKELIRFLMKFNPEDLVMIEPKLDGVSLVSCYRNGEFSHIQLKNRTYSRSEALSLPIKGIDRIVNATMPISSVDVRGEVVIDIERFEDYSDSFSNGRTIVSSMLNTKDVSRLGYPVDLFDFIVFETMPAIELPSSFECVDSIECTVSVAIERIKQDDLREAYDSTIPYLLDGLVFKVPAYEHLGYTKKFPRHHIALKYMSESAVAKVTAINVNETPKGIRQSVGISIEPTGVGGILVRSINLGSVAVLDSLGVKVGDYVKFTLSGGIIPVLIEVYPFEE